MPSKPKRPCSKPGCPNLTERKYCNQHKPVENNRYDNHRGTAAQRGYDSRWRKTRLGYLKKYPLCVHCQQEEKHIPATVVDHIIPHKGDKQLFWDKNNWQPLCKRHHDIKTAKEDGGFGNK
ncbi:HNH endonuclease [Bacillus sp. FJAT-18017]|uniref:HNH endonuclease n=1 Tax=Bacillus sp. FJAT-18017 TaxID=1705566 RepID=UPI0006AF4316|nr:HNH endonuclease [Bacillus sp. FJAT-18017]ALC92070.1 HNH endonuclease [Bacillus sp. FJAT-18017]